MKYMLGGDKDEKVSLLLDYTTAPRDVADPYWTGDFSQTESDIVSGINAFYDYLVEQKII